MTEDRPALISIVGMVRSGSTYLEGQIADLCNGLAVGELVGAWGAFGRGDLLCSCGEAPLDCPFWAEVRRRYPGLAESETISYMTRVNRQIMPVRNIATWRQVFSDPASPRWSRYRSECESLFEAVGQAAEGFGYQVVVESSKHPLFYVLANVRGFPDTFAQELCARVVRDPRGVSFSLENPKAQKATGGGEVMMKGYSSWRTLPFWVVMNAASDRAVPDHAVQLRYEDFGREPYRSWLAKEGLIEVPSSRTTQHQLIANPVRYGGASTFKIDDRWRTGSRIRSILIGIAALPWMKRYGYSLTGEVDTPGTGQLDGTGSGGGSGHGRSVS